MKSVPLAISFALAASLLALDAHAGGQKLKEGEIPKPVIEAVKRKYPDAKLIHFEHETESGKSVFEISFENAGKKMEVELSPDGRILEEATLIAASDLPAEVRKGLAGSRYAKAAVKRVERVILEEKADAPNYELLVAEGGSLTELVIDASGALVQEESQGPEEQGAEGPD